MVPRPLTRVSCAILSSSDASGGRYYEYGLFRIEANSDTVKMGALMGSSMGSHSTV